jgi:hypothetical protein
MSESTAARGSCLCGAVTFEVAFPTLFCAHCHCTLCQRAHGAGYVTWIGVLHQQCRVESGEELLTRYASSGHGTRTFCSRCGSTLFFESTEHADQVHIVLANLHDPIDREPQMHVYFSDRAHWTRLADELPRLGGESGVEPV